MDATEILPPKSPLGASHQSSTNPHPSSYLQVRLAGDEGSSTNPHSEGYLEDRINKQQVEAGDGGTCNHLLVSGKSHEESQLHAPRLQDISSQLPSVDIRAVVLPSSERNAARQTDSSVEPYRLPKTSSDVLVVHQTSQTTGFNLNLDNHAFTFLYDVASDNLILRNMTGTSYSIVSVRSDHEQSSPTTIHLNAYGFCSLEPGPWQICSGHGDVISDFLLLHRRYLVQKLAGNSRVLGSKRKGDELVKPDDTKSASDGGQNIIVFNNPSQLTVVKTGNPLVDLSPGDAITISPAETEQSIVEQDATRAAQPPDSTAHQLSDHYAISHLRDIAANKGMASVFRGKHSVHGDVVVKVIRTKTSPSLSYIAKLARDWQSEQRILSKLNHVSGHLMQGRAFKTSHNRQPSIIKFFGSDSRFYSIYMEYSPDPDLAAYRDKSSGHLFKGTAQDASRILLDMSSALAYLHGQSIIHNDIKPSNILYGRARGPLLIDFGLASTSRSPTCNGGTPWYIPNEYAISGERGPKSDVFALGVTMLYLLRKIPLPEATEPVWRIAQVADPSERSIMTKWLAKLEGVSDQLSSGGIESTVKTMMSPLPNSRASADQVFRKVEAISV